MLPNSPKSLCSLTHTTHTEHSAPHVENPDGEPDDDAAVPLGGEAVSEIPEGQEPNCRFSEEFDFEEFYSLASRVLDGDTASMASLNSLKNRWEEKFKLRQNPMAAARAPTPTTLKPVAGRPSTPFRPRVSFLPRRNVLSGMDAPPLPELEIPNQLDGGPQRSIENRSCPSNSSSTHNLFPSQETLPEEITILKDFDIPIQLDGGLIRSELMDTRVVQEDRVESSSNFESTPSSDSIQDPVPEQPEIYIGTVKLMSNSVDNIAGAFLQSTRKTLHFVPPIKQNGEIVIRPTREVVENGSKKWHATAVGYFLGKRPYFPQLESFVRANWNGLQHVSATSSGFYFFRFRTRIAMEEVVEGGPWLFQGQPIVLQYWEQGMSLRRQKHTQIPVWIRLKHLPMEYWTDDGLSAVASGVGMPLYADGITKECSRLDFARVCVMLDYNSTLPKHLIVISPVLRNGKEDPKRIDVEYEWLPQWCKHCCSLGHTAAACPDNMKKKIAPPITVFVKKQASNLDSVQSVLSADLEAGVSKTPASPAFVPVLKHARPAPERTEDGQLEIVKPGGKEVALHNSFGALDMGNNDAEMVENISPLLGPNNSSPTVGVP
ncbi:UNVERIFIED_CONTAM: hypothetical protein Sangu_3077200 [Sesamum angustifolium]|uniref:DUF4283 domain-containing protein n=1 Tax=Sesamum angustifolium TaxID=2727405 RepID=A0AAW2K7L3_9LAMI